VKQGIAPGKVDKISRKRERYILASMGLLKKLHSLCTILEEGIAHGKRVGNRGGEKGSGSESF